MTQLLIPTSPVIVVRCLSTLGVILFCATAHGQGQVIRDRLEHDGVNRRYSVFVPSQHAEEQSLPLVVNLHALQSNFVLQMTDSQMNPTAEREGFLVAYPNARGGNWAKAGDDNIGFIDAMIDAIDAEYNVDKSRVYITGLSLGGSFSYEVIEALPNRFAAVASVSYLERPPSLSRPFPMMHIHGTADPIVPFNGGERDVPGVGRRVYPPVDDAMADWAGNNSCDATAVETDLPNDFLADGTTVTRVEFANCGAYMTPTDGWTSAETVLYRVNGGAHGWPVEPDLRPEFAQEIAFFFPLNSDIDGSTEIWNFFSRHRLALDLGSTWIGDANLDGEFNSDDLVAVFKAGEYDDSVAENSDWAEGDWDGDGDFTSGDLVAAFKDGGYEQGPRIAANAVPEPSGFGMMTMALAVAAVATTRRRGRC